MYTEKVDSYVVVALISGLVGFFLIPNVSLYIAYAAEVAFPIGEGSAGGYLFAAGQTFGFLLGLIIVSVIDEKSRDTAIWSFMSFQLLLALSFIFIYWTK